MKTDYKVGDIVVAVKDCNSNTFTKGCIGDVKSIGSSGVYFVNELDSYYARHSEIELYEPETSTPKPFPTFADYEIWFQQQNSVDIFKKIYNYFAKFAVREVYPEVGKEYEFSYDGEEWFKDYFDSYETSCLQYITHIRPIQPSRLEQLKARFPNITQEEQTELLCLVLEFIDSEKKS